MIHLTENVATHISNYLKNRGKGEGIRVGVKTSGCSGLAYVLEFVDEIDEHETVCDVGGVVVRLCWRPCQYHQCDLARRLDGNAGDPAAPGGCYAAEIGRAHV